MSLEIPSNEELIKVREEQEKIWSCYENALKNIQKHLMEVEGQQIIDKRKAQIKEWIFNCYKETGSFPDMPSHEDDKSDFMDIITAPDANDSNGQSVRHAIYYLCCYSLNVVFIVRFMQIHNRQDKSIFMNIFILDFKNLQ